MKRTNLVGAAVALAASATVMAGELYNNGPLITYPGAGFEGANVSSISPGQSLYGGNFNQPSFHRADEFMVSGGGWNITSMNFFGYQTNGGIPSTITGLYVQIWLDTDNDGLDADDVVVWGDMETNIMTSTDWSGIYRTNGTDFLASNRAIMNITADGLDITLGNGTYWVEFASTGSTASGPWVPPVSLPDTYVPGNSLLYTVSTGEWTTAIDSGTGEGYELPFVFNGSIVPAPGAVALLGLAGLAGARRRRG